MTIPGWCSGCIVSTTMVDHKRYCLKGFGKPTHWSTLWMWWIEGLPCDCPHDETPMDTDEVANRLGVERLR